MRTIKKNIDKNYAVLKKKQSPLLKPYSSSSTSVSTLTACIILEFSMITTWINRFQIYNGIQEAGQSAVMEVIKFAPNY